MRYAYYMVVDGILTTGGEVNQLGVLMLGWDDFVPVFWVWGWEDYVAVYLVFSSIYTQESLLSDDILT